MTYYLSDFQLQEISKLPPELAALKDQYPVAISLVAEYYDAPPFPQGYEPKLIEIYFDEQADGPGILYRKEKGFSFDFDFYKPSSSAFFMDIDHQAAYVRLGSLVLLNRVEGVVLPDIPTDLEIKQ